MARSGFQVVLATLVLAVLGVSMAGSQTHAERASEATGGAPPPPEANPLSTGVALMPEAQAERPAPPPASSRQLLVVQTATWNTSTGTFRRYQSSGNSTWEPVGESFPVNVGRNGLAWSRGLHAKPGRGPLKREGDGRSPAGIFDLEHAFGYAADPPEGARGFPYLPIERDTVCVEDVRSKDYNRILDLAGSTGTRWERRSVMLRPDGLFRWGVVVAQNTPAVQPGSGSCVFLHVWKGPGRPTAGCTAMSADRIEEIVRWLDPDGKPSLVQLPEAEYSELRESLQLP